MQRSLYVPSTEWLRIMDHLDPSLESFEVIRKKAYMDYLKRTSAEIMTPWRSSDERKLREVQKQNEAKKKKASDMKERFIKDMKEKKVRENEEAMNRAKAIHFERRHDAIQLNNALLFSDVLKYWEAQVQFKKKRKEHETLLEKKRCEEEKKKYNIWLREEMVKRREKIQHHNKEMDILKEQMEENKDRRIVAKLKEIEIEMIDNENAKKEIATLKDFQEKKRMENMEKHKEIIAENDKLLRNKRESKEKRELLEDKLNDVFLDAKYRMDCLFKIREKEMAQQRRKMREEITKKVMIVTDIDEEKDEEIRKKVEQERNNFDDQRRKMEIAKTLKDKKEMQEAYDAHLKEQERQKKKYVDENMQERINCLKNLELSKHYNRKVLEKKMKMMQKHRETILNQINEENAFKKAKEDEFRQFYNDVAEKDRNQNDKEFFEYAEKLLGKCQENNYSVMPIERMVKEYKKQCNLLPLPILPPHLKTHFKPRAMEGKGRGRKEAHKK